MPQRRWLIYGANGYTGRLISQQCKDIGTPVLGGRSRESVAGLAGELGYEHVVFAVDDAAAMDEAMRGCSLVLNCAGPFSATARPVIDACLRNGVHYLDITGEIDVFEHAHGLSQAAHEADIILCPGVGFDVVPTDCVAARLSMLMPDAQYLLLGFDSKSGPSRGTAKTQIEGIARGCKVRRDGKIVTVPLAHKVRQINFSGDEEKCAMTIPWGDVSTAWYTTGIPNIETYLAVSPRMAKRARRMNFLRPVFALAVVQAWMKRQVEKKVRGPDAERRAATPTFIWGEVESPNGESLYARIRVANGYDVTVNAALGIVRRLLDDAPPGAAVTPSQIMGWEYITTLPGSGDLTTS